MDRSIFIYGEVGWEVTAAAVQEQLNAPGEFDSLTLHISSPGGGVFEGWTIGNIIKQKGLPTVAKIEGWCASIATYIALICDSVEMAETSRFMIHNPKSWADGEEEDMQKAAEQLATIKADLIKLYVDKTGLSEEELSTMMDEETWFTPEEAMDAGFVDTIIETPKAVAKFDFSKFKKMKNKGKGGDPKGAEQKEIKDKLDLILDKIKNFNPFGQATEPNNVEVSLADGSMIWVESDDGELEGKPAFTVDEDGEPTETPVADGTHAMEDGRSITIEDGMVVSVQESEDMEDKLNAEIKDLKEQLETASSENAELKAQIETGQTQMAEIMTEVENLKKLTAGESGAPNNKGVIDPQGKGTKPKGSGKEEHSLNGMASHLKNVVLNQ